MISYLSVRNFKLAEAVELDFETGFTTLTGETGAGKSLIIDAVALLLGERARPETIAGQADKAEIQGIFLLEENHAAHRWLIEHELESGAECVIRRIITRKSGSRAMVNGSAVPVQNLKQLGELLVDILGQHEHQLLAGREHQRNTLDAFACIETEVVALSQTFDQLSASRSRFDKLRNRSEADRERDPTLRFALLEEAERIIVEEDCPVLPICRFVTVYMYEPGRLRGLANHAMLDHDLALLQTSRSSGPAVRAVEATP